MMMTSGVAVRTVIASRVILFVGRLLLVCFIVATIADNDDATAAAGK